MNLGFSIVTDMEPGVAGCEKVICISCWKHGMKQNQLKIQPMWNAYINNVVLRWAISVSAETVNDF